MENFDFNSVPTKIFADSVHFRIINGMMHIAVQSGQSLKCFLFPLPMAKMIGKAITKQVAEIEEKNNIKFDDRLPDEPMLSPWTSPKPEGGTQDQKN